MPCTAAAQRARKQCAASTGMNHPAQTSAKKTTSERVPLQEYSSSSACTRTHARTHAHAQHQPGSSACRGFLKKRHISQRAHTFLSLIHAWVPDWPKSTQPLFLSPCTHTRTQTRKNTRTHRHTHSCEHERPETKEGKRVIQLRIREQLQEHYTECWH